MPHNSTTAEKPFIFSSINCGQSYIKVCCIVDSEPEPSNDFRALPNPLD